MCAEEPQGRGRAAGGKERVEPAERRWAQKGPAKRKKEELGKEERRGRGAGEVGEEGGMWRRDTGAGKNVYLELANK